MKKILFVAIMVAITMCAFAAMTTIEFDIASNESINIVSKVEWPASTAVAHLNPPADVNGMVTEMVSFAANSTVVVKGPTHVTLEYGTPVSE